MRVRAYEFVVLDVRILYTYVFYYTTVPVLVSIICVYFSSASNKSRDAYLRIHISPCVSRITIPWRR
jgi:hypothetical protein